MEISVWGPPAQDPITTPGELLKYANTAGPHPWGFDFIGQGWYLGINIFKTSSYKQWGGQGLAFPAHGYLSPHRMGASGRY